MELQDGSFTIDAAKHLAASVLGNVESPLMGKLLDLALECFGELVERPDSKIGKATLAAMEACKPEDSMFRSLDVASRFAVRLASEQLQSVLGSAKK